MAQQLECRLVQHRVAGSPCQGHVAGSQVQSPAQVRLRVGANQSMCLSPSRVSLCLLSPSVLLSLLKKKERH